MSRPFRPCPSRSSPLRPRLLRHNIAGLAALVSLQALLLGGTAFAQGAGAVHIFEEPPPMELLRSIMVPESRPGLTRRIVMTPLDRPAPIVTEVALTEMEPNVERAPAAMPRRPRWQPPAMEAAPMLAAAQAPLPRQDARPTADPVPAPAAAAGSVGFRINFALNSDVVPPSALPFVERIAELLREQPQVKLRIEGHTDALGSDAYNLELSQRRAAAVASHLVEQQGIEPARLIVLGLGKRVSLTENAFDPRNRRVQFARVE